MADYKTLNFKEGDIILKEGEQPENAFVIKTGAAQVFKQKSDGTDALISSLKAGDIIGEMSLIDAAPRSATVVATEDSTVMIIDQASFDNSLESLDNFAKSLMKTLLKRLRIQNKQIAELSEPHEMAKAAAKGQDVSGRSHTKFVFADAAKDKLDFGNINTLVVMTNSQTRQSIKGGMHLQGFREIADCSNAIDFRSLCAMNSYDLIYLDDSIGIDQAAKIIDDIRHGKTYVSPFCVIFASIEKPDPQTLEKFAEAGLDDILVKPVTIGNIIDRVEKRVKTRKKFVVTMDYVGPDRRSNPRPGKEIIPLVDVPNPVYHKTYQPSETSAYNKHCDKATARIETLKIERHAVQIDWLCSKIKTQSDENQNPEFFIKRMREVTQALVEKLRAIEDEVHINLCNRILSMISDIEAGMAEIGGSDWDTFSSLTQNLKLNLGPTMKK